MLKTLLFGGPQSQVTTGSSLWGTAQGDKPHEPSHGELAAIRAGSPSASVSSQSRSVGVALYEQNGVRFCCGANIPRRLNPELLFGLAALRTTGTVTKTHCISRTELTDTWILVRVFRRHNEAEIQAGGIPHTTSAESMTCLRSQWDTFEDDSSTVRCSDPSRQPKGPLVALCVFLTVPRDNDLLFAKWHEISGATEPLQHTARDNLPMSEPARSAVQFLIGLVEREAASVQHQAGHTMSPVTGYKPNSQAQFWTPSSLSVPQKLRSKMQWANNIFGRHFTANMLNAALSWPDSSVRKIIVGNNEQVAIRLLQLVAYIVDNPQTASVITEWRTDFEVSMPVVDLAPGRADDQRNGAAFPALASDHATISDGCWVIPKAVSMAARRSSDHASGSLTASYNGREGSWSLAQTLNKYGTDSTLSYDQSSDSALSSPSAGGSISSESGPEDYFSRHQMTSRRGSELERGRNIKNGSGGAMKRYENAVSSGQSLKPVGPASYSTRFARDQAIQGCPTSVLDSAAIINALRADVARSGRACRAVVLDLEELEVTLWTVNSQGLAKAPVGNGS